MTSPLSKNRQIIRVNTPPSKRFEWAALGVSFLFVLAQSTYADGDNPAPPRQISQEASQRAAAERWQRVKSQYPLSASKIEQPFRRSATEPNAPSEFTPERPAGAGPNSAPMPLTTDPSTVFEGRAAEDELSEAVRRLPDPDEIGNASGLPSPDDIAQRIDSRSEGTSTDATRRGTPRPIYTNLNPSGPPRSSTQIRRMNEIAPVSDRDSDRDIREYAAEKAREFNVRFGGEQYTTRNFPLVAMQWAPPQTEYYPLYFQDPQLERYGHTYPWPLQPVVSAARFSTQLVFMPYQMAIVPPWELRSPLGWYRPGDVVPKLHYQIPWNTTAALIEAGTVTGLVFLIP